MARPFRMVDVFSATPFRGNPVAVVHAADGLDTDTMLRITRWMNLSETTFLLPPTGSGADYRVRIFTLERELPFAGHPTLGSCRAWLDAGGRPAEDRPIVQECGAGLIQIRRQADDLAFAAPPLIRSGPVDDAKLAEVCKFLSIDRADIVAAEWVDNGPGWLAVMLESADAVLAVDAAGHHPRRIDVGLVGPAAPGGDADFEVRALFSDQHGAVREDPVTGSLNASLAQWLLGSGRASAPYVARQGTRLERAGRVVVSEAAGDIWIGGRAQTIVTGTIDV